MASVSPPSINHFDIDEAKQNCFLDGNFSIFDYSLKNALLFSQGDWSLIARDLRLAGVDEESIETLETGPCAELLQAFRIRRETIHYKKVCLHLFEEARRIEKELKQCMSFFFWCDGDDIREGAKAHMDALTSLCKNNEHEQDSTPVWEMDAVQTAMKRHEHGATSCELLDRKIMYVLSCGAWMHHRGVSKAIHDARDISKAICLSPRHPDGEANGERPHRLDALPISMQVEQHLCKVEREDPRHCSRSAKVETSKQRNKSKVLMNDWTRGDDMECIPKGSIALKRILDAVRNELNWPDEAVTFISLSIAARGGFKALAIVEELNLYNSHIGNVPNRVETSLHQYVNALQSHITNLLDKSCCEVSDDDLSAAVSQHKEIHHLKGMLKAARENAKWVQVLTSLNSTTTRLFVVGDDAASNTTCAFVPKGFELGSFIKSSREILDKVLLPTMRNTLTYEAWPPTNDSRRRRVLAYNEDNFKNASIGKKKLFQCYECRGHFDSRWCRHGLCSICESNIRNRSVEGECFFSTCKAGADAFCRHYQRCFVCDAPHSCNECRLYRGNGEVVITLVETLRPQHLLLDFDKTLCSTKSGASPLPRKTSSRRKEDGYVHSIDPDLKAAVLSQQSYGTAYVITRNSHREEIRSFLEMHGLQTLASNIHVVPKKVSKGSYIKEQLFSNEDVGTILFVDDDVKELSADPWLRESPQVHRLLFVRGFLQ